MINLRKCVGCGQKIDRKLLLRVLKDFSSERLKLIVAPTSKDFGRSVYVCYNRQCVDKAFKKCKIFKQSASFEGSSFRKEITEKIDAVLES